MTIRYLVVIFWLCIFSNQSLLASDTLFFKTFGNGQENQAKDIIRCRDGGYLIVGFTFVSEEKKSDAYVLKLDSQFNKVWSRTFGGGNIDVATAVIQPTDTSYLFTGYTNSIGYGGYDVYVVYMDTSGALIWEKTYGGQDWDLSYDAIQTHDQNIVVVGETFSFSQGNSDAYVIKINLLGDTLLTHSDGGLGKDAAYALVQHLDSSLYICGQTDLSSPDSTQILLWKWTKNHQILWKKYLGGNRQDVGYDLIRSSDNQLLIAGATGSLSNRSDFNQYLIKVDTSGAIQWEFEAGNSTGQNLDDVYYSVAQNNAGIIFPAGHTQTYGYFGSKDISITCLDVNGNFRRGNNIGFEEDDWIEKVISSGNQFVFVGNTGSYGNGNGDVFVAWGIDDMAEDSTFYFQGSVIDTFLVSSKEINNLESWIVFPNPVKRFLNVKNAPKHSQVELYSITGEYVKSYSLNNDSVVDLATLSKGTYVMFLRNNMNQVFHRQFLVKD